jgi:phage baseplate assembly protein W
MAVASKLTNVSYVYVDINSDPQSVNEILVSDIDAINTQIYNLFSTTVGEADFEPQLGSRMDNYLFDQNSTGTRDELAFVLYVAFSKWMSDRIEIGRDSVIVKQDPQKRRVNLTVEYAYKRLNVRIKASMSRNY